MATRLNPHSVGIGTRTTSERDGLSAFQGEVTFNTDTNATDFYDGSSWRQTATTGKSIAMSMVFG